MSGHGVAVIGSMMTDLTAVAEKVPRRGETVFGHTFSMVSGGKGSNQAVMAARMAVPTWMVGCVGSDPFRDVVLQSLSGFGVQTEFVTALPGESTGIAHIRVDASGDNDIVIVPNANSRTAPEHVDAFFAQMPDVSVLLLQLEIPLETVRYAARQGKQRGLFVILNPAPAVDLPEDLFPDIDLLTPNETEASVLTGVEVVDLATATEAAQRLCARGAAHVLITLGGDGCLLASRAQVHHYPSYRVSVVDTTAAGDALNGAVGAALAAGSSLEDAVRTGVAAGALTVTRLGAQSSLPSKTRVLDLLTSGQVE